MPAADVERLITEYPELRIDHDNKEYYSGLLQRRLRINRCNSCGEWHHPPRPICPRCWSSDIGRVESPGTGTIQLYTVYRMVDPVLGDRDPAGAVMVTVELDDQPGLLVTSKLIGSAQPTIGARVRLIWIDRRGAPFPAFDVVVESR